MRGKTISSVHNPQVKQWVQLLSKKGRDTQGKFMVEGTHLVQEALRQSVYPVDCVVYSEERGVPTELADYVGQQGEWISVSESVFGKCSDTKSSQSILAVVHRPAIEWMPFLNKEDALVVLIDGVQDPGNLGTIVRSADAAGADGVLLGKGTVDLYNPKTLRSTMGSLFHLPAMECDLIEVLKLLKDQPEVQIVNTSLQAEHSCYSSDFRPSTWFVFGNEGQGVSADISRYVTHEVKIPMVGKAESLNVAMAATVLLFETMRQRNDPTRI